MISSELDKRAQGGAERLASDYKRIIIRSRALGGDRSPGYFNTEITRGMTSW